MFPNQQQPQQAPPQQQQEQQAPPQQAPPQQAPPQQAPPQQQGYQQQQQPPQPPQQGFQQPSPQQQAYQQPPQQQMQSAQTQQPQQQGFQQAPAQSYQQPPVQQQQQQQGFQQMQQPGFGGSDVPPPGIFNGIEGAQVNAGGAFFKPGEYILKLGSWMYKQGRNGNMVIVESDIIQSSFDPQNPATHETNKPGTSASIYLKINDSFLSNFKELIIAASGYGPDGTPRSFDDTVTPQECDAAIGPDQPYAGAIVHMQAFEKQTRGGGTFTRLQFKPARQMPDGSWEY